MLARSSSDAVRCKSLRDLFAQVLKKVQKKVSQYSAMSHTSHLMNNRRERRGINSQLRTTTLLPEKGATSKIEPPLGHRCHFRWNGSTTALRGLSIQNTSIALFSIIRLPYFPYELPSWNAPEESPAAHGFATYFKGASVAITPSALLQVYTWLGLHDACTPFPNPTPWDQRHAPLKPHHRMKACSATNPHRNILIHLHYLLGSLEPSPLLPYHLLLLTWARLPLPCAHVRLARPSTVW